MDGRLLGVLLGAVSAAGLSFAVAIRSDPDVTRFIDSVVEAPTDAEPPIRAALGRLGRSPMARGRGNEQLRRRLDQAGFPWTLDFARGLKVVLAAVAAVITGLLVTMTPMAAALSLVLIPVSYRIPDILIGRMARRRQGRIAAQIPDFAELLIATTRAGLTPPLAFRRSAESMGGPLGEELALALRQIDLGVSWRTVLQEVGHRSTAPALRKLIDALVRTQRLGTSILNALRSVGEDLRAERRVRAEELARRAPVKMLFPLVFLILPAFLLLTVGPVVMATIRSLH
jgi:tight adherence protein C